MIKKSINTLDIVGDFDECPHCKISFLGKDIYQYFLDEYTANWPYKYATSKEDMLKSKSNYPDLYTGFPDNLDDLTDIEANALYTARSYGWTKDNPKTFKKHIIGIEIQGEYDGVLFWKCSECNTYWKRFPWSDLSIVEKWKENETVSDNTEN